jgi:hypothetical protein
MCGFSFGISQRKSTHITTCSTVFGRLRRKKDSDRRDQRPSARGPIQGTCFEACSKRQPRERLVRAKPRRSSGIPPLSGCLGPRLEGLVQALRGRQKLLPCARWVLFLSFSPLRITTAKLPHQAKRGHACRAGPPKHALLASGARCCAASMSKNCAQVLC